MAAGTASDRIFLGVSALLFVADTAATMLWCASMSATGAMPMSAGWTVSMAWMPMCGGTWLGTAASFLGMWTVMMVAMMLPSLVPMLWRWRRAVAVSGEVRLGRLTALAGLGYFTVWIVLGAAVFPLGAVPASVMAARPELAQAAPAAAGLIMLVAGALQFTAWKARHLACCRQAPEPGRLLRPDAGTAWRHGLRLGLHCVNSCAGLTTILMVMGMMDGRVMAAVTVAITAERIMPGGERIAWVTGAAALGAGAFLIVRTAGLI